MRWIWSAFLVIALVVDRVEAKPAKPNIILMMCDDMGWGDTGFNGNPVIQTPNLDKMATEGAVLTHFYSVGPVCSPTRASFLTGRHYYRMGIWTANRGHLPREEYTIARMLKADGYTTGHFGKWHLGTLSKTVSAKGKGRKPEINYAPPWERDYDESFVTESAICTWNPGMGPRSVNNPYYHNGVPETENVMGDDSRVMMDRVIPFIRGAVQNKTPFVAVVWFHAPHKDIQAGPDFLKMYTGYGEAAHYYGCITAMDVQVGRLRTELESLGVADNTVLFFCSDNGPEGPTPKDRTKTRTAGSAGPYTGRKRSVTEGGVRVPALALWPGKIKPDSEIDVPMSVLDYLPTLRAMTGSKLPADRILDGQNVLPILLGKELLHKKPIPFRHEKWACIVDGHFKLIIESPTDSSADRLYDLSTDIKESHNVVADYPEKVQHMRKDILTFLASAKQSHDGADYDEAGYQPVDPWVGLGELTDKMKRKQKKKKNKREA